MKNLIGSLALSSLACFSFAGTSPLDVAKPNTFDYTYAEGSFVHKDNLGVGFRLDGSFDVKPNIAVIAGVQYTSKNDADYTLVSVGAAYHQQIVSDSIKGLDVVAHAALEEAFADYKVSDKSDFGIKVGAGVRYAVQPKLEAFGDFSVATTGDSEVFIKGGVRYTFVQNFAAVASYEFSDNNTLALGLRYTF